MTSLAVFSFKRLCKVCDSNQSASSIGCASASSSEGCDTTHSSFEKHHSDEEEGLLIPLISLYLRPPSLLASFYNRRIIQSTKSISSFQCVFSKICTNNRVWWMYLLNLGPLWIVEFYQVFQCWPNWVASLTESVQ